MTLGEEEQPETRSNVQTLPAPGTVLLIRDEEWLVTRTERSNDGAWFVDVQGISELVRDTSATFSTALDDIRVLDPAKAKVVADESPGYRRARLWLEAMARKTAVPITDPTLTVQPKVLPRGCPTSSQPSGKPSNRGTSALGYSWLTRLASARPWRSG